ncbi:antennal-enriched udp-glycosyltransferase [Stylonychia lemnae]|uniref:Antennal-enriched udp-glycosyltransferase n=1 Tax=Stylonychia lemnae TaxID=5949 RepID=A0A078AUL6_STYLE|nr:antennal-enriched udp-glycosyltransferase [Stylonychia lemnae]|eukprot:CDW86095.1 antennal-enriched udp-glycosyltransferase [Stylonychia lemnae]
MDLTCYLAATGLYNVSQVLLIEREKDIERIRQCGATPIIYSRPSMKKKKFNYSSEITDWAQGESYLENDLVLNKQWQARSVKNKYDLIISDQEFYFPIITYYLGVTHYIRIFAGPYDAGNIMDYGYQKCHSSYHVIKETQMYANDPILDNLAFVQRYQNLLEMYKRRYNLDNLYKNRIEQVLVDYSNFDYYKHQKMPDMLVSPIQGVQPLSPANGQFRFIYPSHRLQNHSQTYDMHANLQAFIDFHKQIIIISFGTLVQPDEETIRQLEKFIYERPGYGFIIKSYRKNKSQDIRHHKVWVLREGLPQRFLLSQTYVKAFITHGGCSSILESLQNAKPMIVLPVTFDQIMNCKHVQELNLGTCIKTKNIRNDLHKAIEKIENGLHEKDLQIYSNLIEFETKFGDTFLDVINDIFEVPINVEKPPMSIYRKMNTLQYFDADVYLAIYLLLIISFTIMIAFMMHIKKKLI